MLIKCAEINESDDAPPRIIIYMLNKIGLRPGYSEGKPIMSQKLQEEMIKNKI